LYMSFRDNMGFCVLVCCRC